MSVNDVVEVGAGRRVLVVVPSVAMGTWLLDVVSLFAADRRIATVTTAADVPPGAADFLRAHGFPPLRWGDAVRREFDLVLAADPRGLAQLRGEPLLLPRSAGVLPPVSRRDALPGDGRVIPRVLGLSHTSELAALRNSWPEAIPVATVVGDLYYDRLLASIPFRADYRDAFGLSRGRKLVLVTSAGDFALRNRLFHVLPADRYQVIVQPEEGWRAALVAADLVIGDLGATTRYAAAIGLPVMIAEAPADGPRADGAAELLRPAPRLRPDRPVRHQVDAAMTADRGWQDEIAGRITSRAGYTADILRRTIYRLLDLAEPALPAPSFPVSFPHVNRDVARPGVYT